MGQKKKATTPKVTSVAFAVGKVTFLEIIRDKVLYNIILCSVILLALGYLASRLVFIRPERVIINFGLSALELSCSMIAVFTGAVLIGKEYDRRTVYVALSRPITHFQFVLGKFLGIAGILTLNWVLLTLSYLVIIGVVAESPSRFWEFLSQSLLSGVLLAWLESLVLSSLAIGFSAFTTTSLSVVFSIGLYLVGNNISQFKWVLAKLEPGALTALLNAGVQLLPDFEQFHLGLKVTYGLPVSFEYMINTCFYGSCLVITYLFIAGLLLRRREI